MVRGSISVAVTRGTDRSIFCKQNDNVTCVWFRKGSTIVTKNASLRARINWLANQNNQHEEMLFNVI